MNTFIQKLSLGKMKILASLVMKKKAYQKYSDKGQYPVSLGMGPISFEVLRCGMKMGIFDELDKKEGQTIEELSASLHIEQYPLKVLIRSLEFLKLLINIDLHYYNHPLNTMTFLSKNEDIFYSDTWVDFMHHVVGPACSYLEESVKTNETHGLYNLYGKDRNFYEAISEDKTRIQYFDAFMKNITNRNKDQVTSDSFFAKHKKVLDVGGSTGNIAISLAQHNPDLRVTVMDFPEILKIASEKFRELGLESRLDTYSGDPLNELPSGHDCIIFFHFFDIFSPEDNQRFLKNAFNALPPGGSIGIFTPVTDDLKSCPNDLLGPYFLCLAEGQGKFYPEKDIVDWIKKENFVNISSRDLPFKESFITAEKS
ncbi:MAG: class I SAM-dependent methyltransferase [Nitrospirota bacterium]